MTIRLEEGRFARLEAIEWWNQARLREARVLVIGAGALGNEVIKNLALLGVGHLVIVDRDRVELSNLSRSVLFRESDEGQPKAECAARAARGMFGEIEITPMVGNVLTEVGLGWFRWAQVIIGALDNREARVFVNAACARVGRPWLDGGIEVLQGIARGFAPPATACYECTMSQVDWELLNKRRSCSLLARRALTEQGTPTTPTTASVIGGIQVQEAIKLLHGMDSFLGRGFVFEGGGHSSYAVDYQIHPDCPWHEAPAPIETPAGFDGDTPLEEVWRRGKELLGGLDAIDLGRELVESLNCSACQRSELVLRSAESLTDDQLLCPACGKESSPTFRHSIPANHRLLKKSAQAIGLPARDIVWARSGDRLIGMELGDG